MHAKSKYQVYSMLHCRPCTVATKLSLEMTDVSWKGRLLFFFVLTVHFLEYLYDIIVIFLYDVMHIYYCSC